MLPEEHPNTFPRLARMTRPGEFEAALRRPDFRLQKGPLRLNAVFTRMQTARLGLIVGKKAVPQAQARNRIKRIIRNRFRMIRFDLGSLDIVFRVVDQPSPARLHRDLDDLFSRVEEKIKRRQRKCSG